jgi:hypothetical protein
MARAGKPWTAEENDQLRKLALSGLSLLEIAARMERHKSSVRTRAGKMQIAIALARSPSRRSAPSLSCAKRP